MMHPLYVAILWHMHQPFYRDMRTGEIPLPWMRLHAVKDYLRMAETLANYPDVHLTINMAPSLTDQLLAWAEGREADELARLAEQEEWTGAEKRTILNLAYSINWDKVIRRYGRYSELLDRRPQALADPEAFSAADYRDLLGWFNLAWIDANHLQHDPILAGLAARGRDFTTQDLRAIHARQIALAAGILPLYRSLIAAGQLEVCTSPYYHPILPLLADLESARRASPGLPLPALPLAAVEDAATQLQLAVEAHTRNFGAAPAGLWPSEGAVSPEVVALVAAAGFEWLATDEALLGRSLGQPFERDGSALITRPHALYRPYRTLAESELGPYIIFRDHELSDRIGFLYQRFPPEQAAEDFIYRLLEIRNRLNGPSTPYLVSIILDGENAWEHYQGNGDPFLHALYAGLSRRPELRAVTVSEFLREIEPRPAATLARLATGSWIGGDLTTWIGDPEHNRAWEALIRTRSRLMQVAERASGHPGLAAAWRSLYIAEGSDWFWWYSHRNNSDQNAVFDRLFRHDLVAVHEALGDRPPEWLEQPFHQARAGTASQRAAGYVSPRLTAAAQPGDDWVLAAVAQPAAASSGTMQRADGVIKRLFVGHDPTCLYLRLDLHDPLATYEVAIYLTGALSGPVNQRARGRRAHPDDGPAGLALGWLIQRAPGQAAPFLYRAAGHEQWQSVSPVTAAAGDKVLEIAIPFQAVGLAPGQDVGLLLTLMQRETVAAQLPEGGVQTFTLEEFPTPGVQPRS